MKLLEVTHGQWLYQNLQVQDSNAGTNATERKEEIQQYIEDQIELGKEGLDPQDHYLLEVNLEDLENTTGKYQQYWLLHIQAARHHKQLKEREQNERKHIGCRTE